MTQKAKCPECTATITWDWCRDTYLVDGNTCMETTLIPDVGEPEELRVMQCTECRAVLGVSVTNDHGEQIHNHPAYKGIEW